VHDHCGCLEIFVKVSRGTGRYDNPYAKEKEGIKPTFHHRLVTQAYHVMASLSKDFHEMLTF
jgi:hypothetical protein